MKRLTIFALVLLLLDWQHQPFQLQTVLAASPDLYIKDTPADTGVEPNPDAGPMWVSEDIWVRTTPDPNYQPFPFPEASPPWIPLPNESPEYRDPKFGVPNYVYVRVRNRGNAASTGTEQLKVYWAKASTGLAWPSQWVDYKANNCGPTKLFGAEITKPRKNAATASPAELNAYRDAILAVGASPFLFGAVSYWHKQNELHTIPANNRHHTPAFLPWHREFVNRYEVLLQEFDPTVKLLYWDWTTDPIGLFTSSFMGASGRGTGGVSIGLPFNGPLAPPTVTRNLSTSTTPPPQPDTTVLGMAQYDVLAHIGSGGIERPPNHDSAHGYIGGGGDMSFLGTAAQDPFFFMLHANVDRLWAQWQRNISTLTRLDPPTAYDLYTLDANIDTTAMSPWDGTGAVDPYSIAGGYIVSKTPKHPSVVSPPIYDQAPLVIPVLQPGEAVVIQIPWYPPNPADFSCFGGDQGHFCLLGRVETSTAAPFGMTTPETADVNANTRNNNNIAWKNVTVVDNFPGPLMLSSVTLRNIFRERTLAGLRFADTREIGASFFDFGRILVDLKPEIFKRLPQGQSAGRGVEAEGAGRFRITSPDALIPNIPLEPGEAFSVDVHFELRKDYQSPRGTHPKWDVIQTGAPNNPNAVVGGQRFELNFDKISLVKLRSKWRYLDQGINPGPNWMAPDFDDSKWKLGQAEFGFGRETVTTVESGPTGRRHLTDYFRHTFDVADPGFLKSLLLRLKRADGAVVYLNGREVHRVNLPAGAITLGTRASREVKGLEEEMFFPTALSVEMLRQGRNVVAVEIHQASPAGQDLSFDLELAANSSFTHFPPDLAFVTPANGALSQAGRVIPITIEAMDADGQVKSVSVYADGTLIGSATQAPFTIEWRGARPGRHRLRAVALDNDGETNTVFNTTTVVANVPPTVRLTQPHDGAIFKSGDTIFAVAQASDVNGKVERVEFYVREHNRFSDPDRLVGTAKKAPFAVSFKDLTPGHYMLTAVAKDNGGLMSQSVPIHFEVQGEHSNH